MSKVIFTDLRTNPKRNLLNKIEDLLDRTKINMKIKRNDLVAIKIHFGEKGNTAYLRPIFVRTVVEKVKSVKGKPFLTDTNTLYTGSRSDAVNHLITAARNGFGYSSVDCPLIIADGLRGSSGERIAIDGEVLKEVSIAKEIIAADAMVVVSHVKAHELTGFGGAIKNLGMGCSTREGKLAQHSNVAPMINVDRCKGCGACLEWCSAGAISMEAKKAYIDPDKCIGCGECTIICPDYAIEIQWIESPDIFQKKLAEYALGATKGKEKKIIYLNFIIHVSPACDCYPNSDAPIVRDIGILASTDPVAIDSASCDLVNNEPSIPNSAVKKPLGKGADKWRALYPSIDWNIQLDHAEKIGLGKRKYTMVKI